MVVKTPLTAKQFERICDDLGPCELERGEVVYTWAQPSSGFARSLRPAKSRCRITDMMN